MSQEIELKLDLPAAALSALRRHPLFAAAPKQGKRVTLDNSYFDTRDLALKAAGVGLRTRRHGHTQLQTVKCAAESAGGLSKRPEWEQAFSGAFDFSNIDAPKVRKLLERHRDELLNVFTTHFHRETRLYAPQDGVRILMMVDTGHVIVGERTTPICELELELVEGQPLDLLRLASLLALDVPLLPNDVSKAERGYRLHLDAPPQPIQGAQSPIDAGQPPVEAFRSLAFSCLRQWQANVAGAAVAEGAERREFVHQIRVALRRLRSLVALFAPALPAEFVDDWRERLKQNAARFAEIRDLAVLDDEILAPVVPLSPADAAALAQLREFVRSARDDAAEDARRSLSADVQGPLLIGLTTALHALPVDAPPPDGDLAAFARARLDRLRRKARRRHDDATGLDPEPLHALRVAVKRLRYAAEFFAPLLPSKATRRYIERLAKAQSALGFVSDVDVARERLAERANETDTDAELRLAAAYVGGWHGRRYLKRARKALRTLEPLLWGKSPWRE